MRFDRTKLGPITGPCNNLFVRLDLQMHNAVILGKCNMSRTDGRSAIEIVHDTVNFKQNYFNESTGDILPEGLVRAATMEELDYVSERLSGLRRTTVR